MNVGQPMDVPRVIPRKDRLMSDVNFGLRLLKSTQSYDVARHLEQVGHVTGWVRELNDPKLTKKVVGEFAGYANTDRKEQWAYKPEARDAALQSVQDLCVESSDAEVKDTGIGGIANILRGGDMSDKGIRHQRAADIILAVANSVDLSGEKSPGPKIVRKAISALKIYAEKDTKGQRWVAHSAVQSKAAEYANDLIKKVGV